MQHLASPWIFSQPVSNRASPAPLFFIILCSSSFWRRMDITLDALHQEQKSSWLNHRLGYLQWSFTYRRLSGSCTPCCCLSPPHEFCTPACPLIHPAFPRANLPHWTSILFLMGSFLPPQYTAEYI